MNHIWIHSMLGGSMLCFGLFLTLDSLLMPRRLTTGAFCLSRALCHERTQSALHMEPTCAWR